MEKEQEKISFEDRVITRKLCEKLEKIFGNRVQGLDRKKTPKEVIKNLKWFFTTKQEIYQYLEDKGTNWRRLGIEVEKEANIEIGKPAEPENNLSESVLLGSFVREKLLQKLPKPPIGLAQTRDTREIAWVLIEHYGDIMKLQEALKKQGTSIQKLSSEARKARKDFLEVENRII